MNGREMEVFVPGRTIVETSLHGVPMLTIVGEADHTVGPELTQAVRRALDSGGAHIFLELGACPYLDSGGLNVLVQLVHDVEPAGWVGVIQASRMILRLLELIGLTTYGGLRIFENLEDAGAAAAAI